MCRFGLCCNNRAQPFGFCHNIHQGRSCNGLCDGSATSTAGGGTAPYTYVWNTTPAQTTASVSGLCAGGYTVSISDAYGCTTTSTTLINQPTGISITLISLKDVSCNGGNTGAINVSVSGGSPGYTYAWA